MNANLACNLIETAKRRPDRPAVKLDQLTLTYQQLDAASARVARFLQTLGVHPGERVGLMLPNVPEFAILYYGILRAGGVVVPMNPLFKGREVGYQLADCEATLLFAWSSCASAAQAGADDASTDCVLLGEGELERILSRQVPAPELAKRAPSDTAVLLYTSGTTGKPKGAELTHANLTRNAEVVRRLFHLEEQSVVLGVLPLFHAFGQTCGLNAAVLSGALVTLVQRFEAEKVLSVIERDRVTLFEGVPTMFNALLNLPERERFSLSTLQLCVSGGASMPAELQRSCEAAFGAIIVEGYGLSETSPVASFNRTDRLRKPGSIGLPVAGVEMRVVAPDGTQPPIGDVGEIVIRGHNVMKGYWKRPEATAEAISRDGWFHTGDLGYVDRDGYFFIVDRKKDMISRGGLKIYPRELEELLYQHPAVLEAAVIGIPHAELGEEVAAVVATRPGSSVSIEEIRDFIKEQVAAYKYPRHVWFVSELPKTATGKILKRAIEIPAELVRENALHGSP
jgi:long-chain acyl-CoA synthetase